MALDLILIVLRQVQQRRARRAKEERTYSVRLDLLFCQRTGRHVDF